MRLKYQLRGLGIGMILGVLLMGVFAGTKEETLTDAQIKERAKALGMEEARVLSDLPETMTETEPQPVTSEEESSVIEELTEELTEEVMSGTEEMSMTEEMIPSTEVVSMTKQPIEQETTFPETAGMDQEMLAGEKMILITIRSGDGSGSVSHKLEQAGLIKDADAYDKYLCKNGYDKKIRVGNHEIPYGATEEEIAKSISSRQ